MVEDSAAEFVGDRYQLADRLGGGNMSTVYTARDLRRGGALVAIKLLNSPHADELKHEMFRRETHALRHLDHPNVVRLLDAGWDPHRACYFIALEYIPRTLLDEIAVHQHDPSRDWCWPLMRQMADGLVHAHSEGIIHRDLKPTNILLAADGTAKLTDFGISFLKFELATGVTVSSFWSVGYAAPEQRAARPAATEQSDLYSLGCVFYHMLAGHAPPADGPTRAGVRALGLPPIVSRIVAQLVDPNPAARLSDARQLRRQLELTRRLEVLPAVYLLVTDAARRALFDQGFISTSSMAAARAFLVDELGGDDPGAVDVQVREDTLFLLTAGLRIVCGRDPASPVLVIKAVQTPYQPALERQRKGTASLRYRWQVVDHVAPDTLPPGEHVALGATLDDLLHALQTHEQQQRVAYARRSERRVFAQQWEAVLQLQRDRLDSVPRLPYRDVRVDGSTAIFTLTQGASDELAWSESAPIALVEGGTSGQTYLGALVSVAGTQVVVNWESLDGQDRPPWRESTFPSAAVLGIYQQEALAALERQRAAVDQLLNGTTLNAHLPEVLRDVTLAEFDDLDPQIAFLQRDLGEDKRRAVRQALATRDLFLLQGPPGTGKTTTLAEIIVQILARQPDARILVSSQSNVAVNHVLARVAELQGVAGQRSEIVRLGRAEKFGQGAQEWALARRLHNWREEVLARTKPVVAACEARLQEVQRARAWRAGATEAAVRDLEECAGWLEEIDREVAAAAAKAEDPRGRLRLPRAEGHRPTALGPSADAGAGVGKGDGDPAPPRESVDEDQPAHSEGTRGPRLHDTLGQIAETLALIRATLPDGVFETVGIPPGARTDPPHRQGRPADADAEAGHPLVEARALAAERARLGDAIATLLRPQAALGREQKILELVNNWRKVFGRDHDFARPIVARANILAATCLITGSAALKREEFDWAIVDEAGRATAPELLVPLVRARRAIVVGDERQLPPMVDDDLSPEELASLGLSRDDLTESLFETLVAQGREAGVPGVQMLTEQHRMHPAIGRLISAVFYDGHLTHGVAAHERAHGLPWLAYAVVWYSTSTLANRFETRIGKSYANPSEARGIEQLLEHIQAVYRLRGERREVAVITPYNAQIVELQRRIQPDDPRWAHLDIEIATVDAFQGRDRDIVLYSAVRSNREGDLGFLKDRRRLNVALSRARQLLMVVGDLAMLEGAPGGREGNPYHELARYWRTHPEDCLLATLEVPPP